MYFLRLFDQDGSLPTALFVIFLFCLVIYFVSISGHRKPRTYRGRKRPPRNKIEINVNK